jgi:uncharacterized membrane protein
MGLLRSILRRTRLLLGVFAGLVGLVLLPSSVAGVTRALLAWDIGVLMYLLLSLQLFLTARPEQMPANAEAEQDGEWTIFALTLGVIVVSFIAVGQVFGAAKGSTDHQGWVTGLVAVTLFLSWLMTHVTFAYRYAHEFYERKADGTLDGGLDFPGDQQPDYMDFLYFSLVLGMTFQVSDVDITSRKLRKVALLQGLLSFLFNAVIIALVVNIAAGFAH